MSNTSSDYKKYIFYDHKMDCLKEVTIRQEEKIGEELEKALNNSVMFLQYGNAYYYREIAFLS